ncbi:DUF6801 domain-containing protein [Amycolatopsis nigrescens]|uniref:DUF6801 domain-containing protein n=1 Tax=Amycolatopsis nigrescens TaxID=381445 RepID=UPI00035DEA88|nr:DUF6801 domain-containing protein [Amycolatopsis nigrescens]
MTRRLGRLGASLATVGLVAAMATALGTGTAAAADIVYETGDLSYTCEYPLLGPGALTVHAKAIGPDSVASGSTATVRALEVVATVPSDVAGTLYDLAGVDGLRGFADADVIAAGGTLDSNTATDIRIAEQFYNPGTTYPPFPVAAHQDSGTFIPTATAGAAPGPLTISLDNAFTVRADFHFLNADPAWQEQAPFSCVLDGGQDAKLGSATIT